MRPLNLGKGHTERHTNQERRFSSENDVSGESRASWWIERAQRFQKQVATLSFSVPTDTGVATCDDDPTDGHSYRALTHPRSTPTTIVWTKNGGFPPRFTPLAGLTEGRI